MAPETCPFCGWALGPESKFCPSCGCRRRSQPVEDSARGAADIIGGHPRAKAVAAATDGTVVETCPHCGKPHNILSVFCASCGRRVDRPLMPPPSRSHPPVPEARPLASRPKPAAQKGPLHTVGLKSPAVVPAGDAPPPAAPAPVVAAPPPARPVVPRRMLVPVLALLALVLLAVGALVYVGGQTAGSGGQDQTSEVIAAVASAGGVALDVDAAGHRATALNPAAWAALKRQAAADLRAGHTQAAAREYAAVTANDLSDAESWIYRENLRALASSTPPYRIAVGGSFSGANVATGREVLQGVYTAQKEINDAGGIGGHLLSLVLADDKSTSAGALQSARAIAADKGILAVVGYRYSARAAVALPVLAGARIAMVTPTAGSPNLNTSSYFFRVCPSDTYQGVQAAHYMMDTMLRGSKAPLIAVFADPNERYSSGLSAIVSSVAQAAGAARILPESYTIGATTDFAPQVHDLLAHHVTAIYFAGYAREALLLARALDAAGAPAGLQIMSDDAFYNPSEFIALPGHKKRFHFTGFFYPDEWRLVRDAAARQVIVAMEARYTAQFHRRGTRLGGYGTSRVAAGTALSYDALRVIAVALRAAGAVPSRERVSVALASIGTTHPPYQGVTGRTAFATNGDPVDKALLVMHLDAQGYTKLDGFLGTFR